MEIVTTEYHSIFCKLFIAAYNILGSLQITRVYKQTHLEKIYLQNLIFFALEGIPRS